MQRNDQEIKRIILEDFFSDSRIDAAKISITVANGIVSLVGEGLMITSKITSDLDNFLK